MEVNGVNKIFNGTKNREENLPHELVTEILSWLPIKHLCPLRFVSKSWLQLLTKDPQFAKLQLHRFMQSNPNPSIIALEHSHISNLFLAPEFESCDKALTLPVPFNQAILHDRLSGISNGLLCFAHNRYKEVYIWNPIINDHIMISCLPVPSIRSRDYASSTGFGFGFDQDSNVYKVVRVFTEFDFANVSGNYETWTQISVYTIGVDSMWRTVQLEVPCNLTPTSRIAPLVNGVLHWLIYRLDTGSYDRFFTFDLKREVIGELALPPCGIRGMKWNEIVELGGLLCVVDGNDVSEIHIWVMKEYGLVSSWSKQYVIAKRQGRFYDLVPLGVTDNGEIITNRKSRKLALYSPDTKTVRDLKEFREAVFLQYAYIGSIISPTVISRAAHNLLKEES